MKLLKKNLSFLLSQGREKEDQNFHPVILKLDNFSNSGSFILNFFKKGPFKTYNCMYVLRREHKFLTKLLKY